MDTYTEMGAYSEEYGIPHMVSGRSQHLQYATQVLLYEDGSQDDAYDGVGKVGLFRADQEDHHKPSDGEQNGPRLEDDVQDKPAGPRPSVVPAQERPQGQEEPPGRVHEHTVEVEEGEGGGGATLVAGALSVPRQPPDIVQKFLITTDREGWVLLYMLHLPCNDSIGHSRTSSSMTKQCQEHYPPEH